MENPKLCFMALSILAIPMFVKPALVASYHFVFVMFPRVCEKLLAWLTPSILYVFINCIILAILANSSLLRSFNITGSSLEEHKPWAEAAHYQRHQPEEPIYEEKSTATSESEEAEVEECTAKSEWEEEEAEVEESTATSELEEEEAEAEAEAEESTTTSESEEEEAEVSSAAKAITEGRGSPLRRHFQKSENWETAHRADATDAASRDSSPYSSSAVYRKSETWSNGGNRTDNVGGRGEFGVGLGKEASLSLEELNRQVEAFIAKVKNDMKLERE